MTQATDVTIAGVGYALAPGGYKREQAGASRRLTGRVAVDRFGAGQLRAYQAHAAGAEVGGGWSGLGVGPALGGQAVEPFPHVETYTQTMSAAATPATSAAARAIGLVANGRSFVAIGQRVYEAPTLAAPVWSAMSVAFTLPVGWWVTDLARYQDDMMILAGPLAMKRFNTVNGLVTDPWVAGQGGHVGAGYRGQLCYAPYTANAKHYFFLSRINATGALVIDPRIVDDAIIRIAPFAGKLAIATASSIFLYAGNWNDNPVQPWDTATEPLFSHGAYAGESEFVFLVGYLGSLFTWVANRVVSYRPGSDAGWRANGPTGRACYGGAVAGGYLVVALVADDGGSEVWAFDGAGWFRLRREEPGSGIVLIWPVALAGAGNTDLLLFRHNSTTYELLRLVPRAGLPTYAAAGEWRSSLLDAGERGTAKGWVRLGALFAEPQGRGNAASADPVTVTLDASLDAGQSWTTVASRTGGFDRSFVLEGVPPAGTASRLLQLRVRWDSVLDWAPVLAGVWADWEIEDAAAARSRWTLVVATKDGQVGRDGRRLPETGRQQIAALWNAWATGGAVVFRDIDHDANPIERVVTIADIEQITAKASDAGRWGEGTVKLTLSEA